MIDKKYSAGLVSQSFWFIEFKKMIRLIDEGKTEKELKMLCLEENLFGAVKEYRAKRMYGYIYGRVTKLDNDLRALFLSSDLQTQKLINLIAVLRGDRLFFEFLFEVYREKIILGEQTLEDKDANIFFSNKGIQSESVAKLTEVTKKKLRSTYFNFMIDANLLSVKGKEKMITPPILDIALERYLEANRDKAIIKALTGVN